MRCLRCIIGHAEVVLDERSALQLVEARVFSPVPLARNFVVGIGTWSGQSLLALGFAEAPPGPRTTRLLLLNGQRQLLLGVEIDRVEGFVELASVEPKVIADSGPMSFFRRGIDRDNQSRFVLDVPGLLSHTVGAA